MEKINLQMFAANSEAVSGRRIIYLYRVLKNAATTDAKALAFTTENSRSKSRDADSIETKDGPIRTPGAMEQEISATSLLSKDDTMIESLENAMDNGEIIEIWEINLDKEGQGENDFAAVYFQGYLTEFEQASNAEDFVECSLTFGINGNGAKGSATLTEEQLKIASYVYTEITKTGA